MNLVAKEYVAAQDPDDPGVLILSRFAGAAIEFRRALLVNPYDPESVAGAIAQALTMPIEERRARHQGLLAAGPPCRERPGGAELPPPGRSAQVIGGTPSLRPPHSAR